VADGGIKVDGLRELRSALRKYGGPAGVRELNKELKPIVEREVIPTAKALTPRLTGKLAEADKVNARGDRIVLVNRRPYAAKLHWSRAGIKGRPFFTAAMALRGSRVKEELTEAIERGVQRALKR
jgi:hypothetical protein